MRFSTEWFEGAPYSAPEENATAAVLRILLGNVDLTEHSEPGQTEVSSGLVMPTYSLAHGLARDWWTIFGAREGEYRLAQHRLGYAMPDVRFHFDGRDFHVRSEAVQYRNPAVRFWPQLEPEVLTRPIAEKAISELINDTIAQLREKEQAGSGLQLRWEWVQDSRQSASETSFCEAAGALRVDPYSIDDHSTKLIEQSSGLFEGEALIEFLGGVGRAKGQDAVSWIRAADRRPANESRLPRLRSLADKVAIDQPERDGEPMWSLGYRRARATRKELSFDQARRIPSMRDLSGALDTKTFIPAPPVNGLQAVRMDKGKVVHVHLRSQGDREEAKAGHNFALARAVGDAVCFPQPGRFAVNRLRDAARQAAGRAFAAEFLAPINEIRSMVEDGWDTITIADEFGVSTQVVDHQLENSARIQNAYA